MYCDLKEGAREAVCIAIQTGRAAGTHSRASDRGAQVGARGAHGMQARRWARDLGVVLGCGLCTWCTQPVFYSV